MARPDSIRNIVVDWSDIKQRYIDGVAHGKRWSSQPYLNYRLQRYHEEPYKRHSEGGGRKAKNWEGGTPAETLGWTRHGYKAPEFAHSAEMVPRAIKRRNVWNSEDGDIDPGRLLAGRDDFYLGSQKREARHGLHVQVEFAFAWTVSSDTITAYGAWVAGFLASLEASGYDLVVDLWVPLDNLFTGEWDRSAKETKTPHHRTNVLIRVKRQNEVSDFTEWSALFAPTGYRHLGFTAHAVAGDKIDRVVAPYFGLTIGGKTWGVDYDREDQTVMITVNQRAGGRDAFPIDRLNEQAMAQGLIPRPQNFQMR